jgi:hypothetical protein
MMEIGSEAGTLEVARKKEKNKVRIGESTDDRYPVDGVFLGVSGTAWMGLDSQPK